MEDLSFVSEILKFFVDEILALPVVEKSDANLKLCRPCIEIYQCNNNQQDALFTLNLFQ